MPEDTIVVERYSNGIIHVSECIDPFFSSKLLLEGVGVLITEISKYSKTCPSDIKKERWNLEKSDVLKLMHEYLDKVGEDYKETEKIIFMKTPY